MTKPLELIGAITLIISLIFIGYEIRLANRIALVETEWEMFNSYAGYNEMAIQNPELFVERPISEYTETEILGKRTQFFRTLNIWLAAETAYSNGMISEATYLITLADAQALIATQKESGTIVLWQSILDRYSFLGDKEIIKIITKELNA
ncbi:MAG: hypothetical protein VX206_05835 [Pseudomonadota bacterium]|nr:hypothetical protein [Pseudomonadota bacterium]